jgi:hypothetical protein
MLKRKINNSEISDYNLLMNYLQFSLDDSEAINNYSKSEVFPIKYSFTDRKVLEDLVDNI